MADAAVMMPAMEWEQELGWQFDPLEALRRWPGDRRLLLLHSGRYHPRWSRCSILAEPAGIYRFHGCRKSGGRSHWTAPEVLDLSRRFTHKPFSDLRLLLAAAPAQARWIGYLSYDLGRWIEHQPSRARADRDWPMIELAYCPTYMVHDTAANRWRRCGLEAEGSVPDLTALPPVTARFAASNLRSVFTADAYRAMVARAIEYIWAGDIFQVNLAQRFTADCLGPFPHAYRNLFTELAGVSPAWYGAYLELTDADEQPARVIASTSPELFLEVNASGQVITRPIKGTRPASADADELLHSEKDAAELNMIVDLLRNDLGRTCDYGSVRVVQPRTVESHPTVHHGVATVAGQLHSSKDVVDLIRAAMPGGSITGAPKVRAMQIIDELEPVRRGPYCGAIGYLSREHSCLNVAIRTMQIESDRRSGQGRVDYSVGGGIVADSHPAAEYQETLDKAAAIVKALGLGIGETIRQS
jgi:para-aminobenzoate synthetase component I